MELIAHVIFLLECGHTQTHKVTNATDHPTHVSAIACVGNKAAAAVEGSQQCHCQLVIVAQCITTWNEATYFIVLGFRFLRTNPRDYTKRTYTKFRSYFVTSET